MFLNPGFFILSLITSSCLFAISVVLYTNRVESSIKHHNVGLRAGNRMDNLSRFLGPQTSLVPPKALTAVLPVLSANFHRTQSLLEPFLEPQEHLQELVIVCPAAIASAVRRVLQRIFASLESEDHPDISLHLSHDTFDPAVAPFKVAADITTDWVLIMDESGLMELDQEVVSGLLHPPNVALPFGPYGETLDGNNTPHISIWGECVAAKYLYPPFVVPVRFPPKLNGSQFMAHDVFQPSFSSWADFGLDVANYYLGSIGGILLNRITLDQTIPDSATNSVVLDDLQMPDELFAEWKDPIPNETGLPNGISWTRNTTSEHTPGSRFIFLLPTREDLKSLVPLICAMRGIERWRLEVLVYNDPIQAMIHSEWTTETMEVGDDSIEYDIFAGYTPLLFNAIEGNLLLKWIGKALANIDVILCLKEKDPLVSYLTSDQRISLLDAATIIKIPRLDLGQTEWMSSLSLEEWTNWYSPRVDITVITNDRPLSLKRLLRSLLNARYFGDTVDLRIYVEQNCDEETLRIVENVIWPFGTVFVHRRVVHGGLLPAIVESWYPNNNDSYGLLLEDDVELSPLFYAWVKMGLLRYRYGAHDNKIPTLFGISLYQQKNLELPLEGRQPFDPRSLFSNAGLEFTRTPYLSQVPCSWGAVYFPEHWREFHDFLALRLSETFLTLEDDIVPQVRSNQWSKSWKRFFIELVFLRGYVMLYPNYEDFASFSTNHLEVGSHVKDRSPEKQDLFLLPLLSLQRSGEPCQLLDIPRRTLPPIVDMPVLNLTGFLTSLEEVVQRGYSRRFDLTYCKDPSELYSIRSFMCIHAQ